MHKKSVDIPDVTGDEKEDKIYRESKSSITKEMLHQQNDSSMSGADDIRTNSIASLRAKAQEHSARLLSGNARPCTTTTGCSEAASNRDQHSSSDSHIGTGGEERQWGVVGGWWTRQLFDVISRWPRPSWSRWQKTWPSGPTWWLGIGRFIVRWRKPRWRMWWNRGRLMNTWYRCYVICDINVIKMAADVSLICIYLPSKLTERNMNELDLSS